MANIVLRLEFTDKMSGQLQKMVEDFDLQFDKLRLENTKYTAWDVLVSLIVGDIDPNYKILACEWEDDESVADHERNGL
jgi:hypothetical protein